MVDSLHRGEVSHLFFSLHHLLEHISTDVVPLPHEEAESHHNLGVVQRSGGKRLTTVVSLIDASNESTSRSKEEGVGVLGWTGQRLLVLFAHLYK